MFLNGADCRWKGVSVETLLLGEQLWTKAEVFAGQHGVCKVLISAKDNAG